MLNALTIDVEDYFQVNAFAAHIPRNLWDSYPRRVAGNTRRILDMLDEFETKATFFVLGWVAEREPELVREISSRGHEVACHGYRHELVYRIGPKEFRSDVRRAKQLLEDISGSPVDGYRAPSYSITGQSLWALEILVEEGFRFDSSIFPIIHDTYGIRDAKRFPHDIETQAGVLREFPLTTMPLRLAGKELRFPVAGGGYLRLFPASFIRAAMHRINEAEAQPTVLYFHPWEIDPDQPRIPARFTSRLRHYLNLHRTEQKIRHLLGSLRFAPMTSVIGLFPGKV